MANFCLEMVFLCEIAWKNRNFLDICLEKSKFFSPGSTTPQILNQIDAAGH